MRGSCFAVSPDGFLITNGHVVEPFQSDMRATLKNEEDEKKYSCKIEPKLWVFFEHDKYEAKVVYVSSKFDIAVMKVDRTGPYFRIGASAPLLRTTDVFAIGFPKAVSEEITLEQYKPTSTRRLSEDVSTALREGDFAYTITKGIINLTRNEGGKELILHSAQLSGGNSGGPLINQNGVVLGINTFSSFRKENETNIVQTYYAVEFHQMLEDLRKHVPGTFK